MCVIAYQKTNQELLTYDEIKAMANKNPHGMGWMALIDGKVNYKKGYFDVDKFYKDYVALATNKACSEIALHFRIGTGSNIDTGNCHPFPITKNKNRIKSTQGRADVCVMMNGIIGNSTPELSDTALYVMKQLKSYYDYNNRFWLTFSKKQLKLFNNEIHGTRWVFMSSEGSKLFGEGWSDYNGKCQVSNRYWIPYYYRTYPTKSYGMSNWNSFVANTLDNKPRKYKSYIDYLMDEIG